MPLRAIVDGKNVIGPLLSEEEWNDLKVAVKTKEQTAMLPCCNGEARLRVSKLGTQHFFHKPDSHCNWAPETIQHLLAKAEIARACKEAGFEVSTEVSGPDWRADVFATDRDVRAAFEVQWSPQTLEETTARQERYTRDGVRGFWLFRKVPDHVASHDIPIFGLKIDDGEIPHALYDHRWSFPFDKPGGKSSYRILAPSEETEDGYVEWSLSESERAIALSELAPMLARGEVRYSTKATTRVTDTIRIGFVETTCWKCHKPSHIYEVHERRTFQSTCGFVMNRDQESHIFGFGRMASQPHVQALVQEFLASEARRNLRIGEVKLRCSKTVRSEYPSFGCPFCDSLFGEWYLSEERFERIYEPNQGAVTVLEKVIEQDQPVELPIAHWCVKSERGVCDP